MKDQTNERTPGIRRSKSEAEMDGYQQRGRDAVRRYLADRGADAGVRAARDVLAGRRVGVGVVRFWILEDLIEDRSIESMARRAYPELRSEFDTLDAARVRADERRLIEAVGRDVDAAMRELAWPDSAG